MATSSHYHRGAPAPHSHYHALPSSHEHLYANLASSWQVSQDIARAPLQRFSSSAPRSFSTHYFDYGAPGDYVNQHPGPQPSPWPAGVLRQASQVWTESLADESFAARPLSYADVDARAPAPQHDPGPSRPQQHASGPAHAVLLDPPEQVFRPAAHQHEHQLSSELAAAPAAPPFPPQAPGSASVARLLNYPNPNLQVSPQHASSQPPPAWPAGSTAEVPQESPPQSLGHTGSSLPADVVLSGHGNLSSAPWGMLNAGSGNATSPVYEHMAEAGAEWSSVEPPAEGAAHLHLPALATQFQRALPAPRGTRRAGPKRSVARVPAAFVERQVKVKISKRKGPLDEASRQKTHQMRKEKTTCLRCRFYKSGCDCGDPCQKCLKIEGNARSFKLPCTRDRLEDASLVRHCNGRSNQEEGEFLGYDWIQGTQLYEMEIIWNLPGYGPISMAQPMRITFRQYHPKRPLLDTATSVWSNTEGQVKVVEQPPYAIYDTASLVPAFERYFSHLQPAIENWIFDRVRHDEIALLTYNEVMRVRRKHPPGPNNLLELAMRIQCLSVVSQGYGTVWSNNIPGIQEYDYGKMGRSSYEAYDRDSRDRPLPGAINHQMDVAALKYLKKLERACVKELSSQMFKPKIKPWYELFLALYVLFWNMEYIHRGAEKYIMSKNGTAIESHVSSVVSNQLKKWEWAFQVLIHHWIAILRGYFPFKLARENPEELRERGHLDPEGFQYVMKVAQIFDRIGFEQTTPYVGYPSHHHSLQSEWIRTLFKEAGA